LELWSGKFTLHDWDLSATHVYASFEDKKTNGAIGYILAKISHIGELGWNKWYDMGLDSPSQYTIYRIPRVKLAPNGNYVTLRARTKAGDATKSRESISLHSTSDGTFMK